MMLLHSCRKGEIHTAFGMLPLCLLLCGFREFIACFTMCIFLPSTYATFCYGTDAWMAVRRIRKCPLKVPAETEIPFQLRPPSLRPLAVGPFDQNTQSSPPWAAPPLQSLARMRHAGTSHRRFGGALSHTHIQSPSYSDEQIIMKCAKN